MTEEVDESMLDKRQRDMRRRLNAILDDIANQSEEGGPVILEPFVASTSLKYGIRRQVVREYLSIFKDSGKVEIQDGAISYLSLGGAPAHDGQASRT